MPLFSWLHKRMTDRPQTQRTSRRKPTVRFRPQLETLEGRDVPSTLTVTSTRDNLLGSLRGEIAAAHPGDTITFAPSLDNQTIYLTSQLSITKNLNIQGPGAGLLTLRPATYFAHPGFIAPRIFSVAANTQVTISGLTLADGGGTAYGADIGGNTGGNSPSAYDDDGGAILNFGTLTVSGCTLTGNTANVYRYSAIRGGAIYNAGTLILTDSTLSGNTATAISPTSIFGQGGALFNAGTATITGSTITGNSAIDGYGGGIFSWGTLYLDAFTVANLTSNRAPTDPNIYGSFQML